MFCSSFHEIRRFSYFRHTFYLSIRFVVIFIRRFIIGIIISKKKKLLNYSESEQVSEEKDDERLNWTRDGRTSVKISDYKSR